MNRFEEKQCTIEKYWKLKNSKVIIHHAWGESNDYSVIYLNGQEVGLASFHKVTEKHLHIFLIEMFDKRRGYGSSVIQEIKNRYEYIDLIADGTESVSFFSKNGFSIDPNSTAGEMYYEK
ncbi:MAG: hypothetical protein JEZ08_25505 [Clostridiales bacterium]|nr:hypothetical protein [Clostridiales bacterium]